jgi:hypothetical protein
MIWVSPRRRLALTVALLVGLIVVGLVVSHAHNAKPQAGVTYTGTVFVETAAGKVTQQLPISFGVTRSGRRVSAFRLPGGLPRGCPRQTVGSVTLAPGSAPLATPGRFEVNLALADATGRVGTLEISGDFHALNHESGAVATRYSAARLRGCDASGGYVTKAAS